MVIQKKSYVSIKDAPGKHLRIFTFEKLFLHVAMWKSQLNTMNCISLNIDQFNP